MSFKRYLNEFERELQTRGAIAKLLNEANEKASQIFTDFNENMLRNRLQRVQISNSFKEMFYYHFLSLYETSMKQYENAFNSQKMANDQFLDGIKTEEFKNESEFFRPAYNIVCTRLRTTAMHADADLSEKGKYSEEFIRKAVTEMRKVLSKINSIPTVDLMGYKLLLTIHLYKLNFKVNQTNQCKFLTKTLEKTPDSQLQKYSAYYVAFKYYLGRLCIFDHNYKEAEKALDEAFIRCNRNSFQNKKKILKFLLVVKVNLGKMPKRRLLQKYKLENEYVDIFNGIRRGNIILFEKSLKKNETLFIRMGTFLLMEKLKAWVFRQFFKRVYGVSKEFKKNVLIFPTIQKALKVMNFQMDNDELECIIANLIYDQYIKGYIAHGEALILSAKNPFPKIKIDILD